MLPIKQIEIVVQDSSQSTGISGKMEKGLRVFCSHLHNLSWQCEDIEVVACGYC